MLRDTANFRHLPERAWNEHQFCFWIHDRMAEVLRQSEEAKIASVTFEFEDENEKRRFAECENVLESLKASGKGEIAKRIVLNQIVIPLFSDMLHFVYEALTCLERRKITVAFALLRKPLKYSLLLATWLSADEDDFYARIESSPAEEMDDRKIPAERRRELLRLAVRSLGDGTSLDGDVLYEILFEKGYSAGLAPYFDMAAHLVTANKKIRTAPLNLNFIFKKPSDTDVYDNIYYPLSYALMYLLLLELQLFAKMASISKPYMQWLKTVLLGSFEALFSAQTLLLDELNSRFIGTFFCIACHETLKISKEIALEFFLSETFRCEKCKSEQQFPLSWLMMQADL